MAPNEIYYRELERRAQALFGSFAGLSLEK
jgi:hypothetical protein